MEGPGSSYNYVCQFKCVGLMLSFKAKRFLPIQECKWRRDPRNPGMDFRDAIPGAAVHYVFPSFGFPTLSVHGKPESGRFNLIRQQMEGILQAVY